MKKIVQVIGMVLIFVGVSFTITTAWAGEDLSTLRKLRGT